MKTMNNRKRVSFGSKGSMVETWIIEDLPTPRSSVEEDFFSNLMTESKTVTGLESRDNPFLPGGDLSRETEELLKRATIVRDKFYLDQQERKQQLLQANNQSRGGHTVSNKEQTTYSADDGELPSANSGSRSDMDGAMEERISPPSYNRAEVGVEFYPRENGKAGDNLDTSPAGIKLDVGGSPTADGHKAANNDNATDQSDRAKRRPKCCVVM